MLWEVVVEGSVRGLGLLHSGEGREGLHSEYRGGGCTMISNKEIF